MKLSNLKALASGLLLCAICVICGSSRARAQQNSIGKFRTSLETPAQDAPTCLGPANANVAASLVITCYDGNVFFGAGPVASGSSAGVALTATASMGSCPTDGACNFIYADSGGTLHITTSFATAFSATTAPLYFVATNATTITRVQPVWRNTGDAALLVQPADGEVFISGTSAGCLATPTTLTIAAPQLYVRAALNNTVYSVTSSAAAGSFEIDCDLAQALPTRLTAGKGLAITAINVLYGDQAAAPTSIANAQFATVTYPAVGGAASGTVSTALATTVTPGMSHSTPVVTTSGQCVNEGNVLTTPLAFTALIPRLTYSQVFSQSAASAMTVQVCGFQVKFSNTVL